MSELYGGSQGFAGFVDDLTTKYCCLGNWGTYGATEDLKSVNLGEIGTIVSAVMGKALGQAGKVVCNNLPEGSPCLHSKQCFPHYCKPTCAAGDTDCSTPGVCTRGKAFMETCAVDSECDSGTCGYADLDSRVCCQAGEEYCPILLDFLQVFTRELYQIALLLLGRGFAAI